MRIAHQKCLILSALLLLTANQHSWAQRPPATPLAPILAPPLPLGMQRGTSLELTLTGSNLAGPISVLASFPAKITIPNDNNNGQDNAKLRVHVDVPADAPLGYGIIHLATKRGISNARLLCIDDLPQVVETGANRTPGAAQVVPIPCVACGRVDAQKGTYFKIAVKAGQRLAFDLLGRRLGSPLDPQLTILDEPTGRMLAFELDSPGLQNDPRIVHTCKADGNYIVEIKDSLNRGGADYAFRLRIGDFPCAAVPIPMAGKRGSKTAVTFAGPEVASAKPAMVNVPNDPVTDMIWVAPQGNNGLHGWPVALALSDLNQVVEQEPNDVKKAQTVPFPCGITGRFLQSGDSDVYSFEAKKGQAIVAQATTLEWHSPTPVYMILRNAKTGAELAKTNSEAAPPADQLIEFTAPDDGAYVLEVQQLNFAAGPSEAYYVALRPKTPDFKLTIAANACDVPANGWTAMPVDALRDGYNGPIEVRLDGGNGLVGATTIEAGQKSAVLPIFAKAAAGSVTTLFVVGQAKIDNQMMTTRRASTRAALGSALADLPYPPRLLDAVAVAVTEPPPLTLTAKVDAAEVLPGATVKFTVVAKRGEKLDDVVTLNNLLGIPANVALAKQPPAPIAKGKGDSVSELKVAANAPLGTFDLMISGKIKQKTDEFQVYAEPVKLIITNPVAMKFEPGEVKLPQGDKAKLQITTTRKAGYKGPIKLEIRKLPTGVTAESVTIAEGKDSAIVEIQAAANAAIGDKNDVEIAAIATAANNLTEVATLVLRIEKK